MKLKSKKEETISYSIRVTRTQRELFQELAVELKMTVADSIEHVVRNRKEIANIYDINELESRLNSLESRISGIESQRL